jgi:hypothetical protein
MVQLSEKNLQYYVFKPNKNQTDAKLQHIQEQTFSFWNSLWSHRFSDSGAPDPHWRRHFFEQTYITTLWHNESVLGCHLYTCYDLNRPDLKEFEYFSYVTSEALSSLVETFGTQAMTMEYLCANPEFKRNSLKLSVGKSLIILGTFLAEQKDIDCALGMPIDGTTVNQKADDIDLGGVIVQRDIEKYGYKLLLRAWNPKGYLSRRHEEHYRLATNLWERRLDYTRKQSNEIQAA